MTTRAYEQSVWVCVPAYDEREMPCWPAQQSSRRPHRLGT